MALGNPIFLVLFLPHLPPLQRHQKITVCMTFDLTRMMGMRSFQEAPSSLAECFVLVQLSLPASPFAPQPHLPQSMHIGVSGGCGLGCGRVAGVFCSTQVCSGAALPHGLHRGLRGSCLGSLRYINVRGPWPTPLVCLCSGSPFAGQAFAACSCKWAHLSGGRPGVQGVRLDPGNL